MLRVFGDAERLGPEVNTPLARGFLKAAGHLPRAQPRTLYLDRANRAWHTLAEREALPEAARAVLEERVLDEDYYYNTRYGSPLGYVRAIELLALHAPDDAGFSSVGAWQRKRVLDYGYGGIGHLRLMAINGAHVVGIETDTSLERLYNQPGDIGLLAAENCFGPPGSIRLRTGRFPVDPHCTPVTLLNAVGTPNIIGGGVTQAVYIKAPFDLFISKNTLKNGYINPSPPDGKPVDKRMLVDLGTDAPGYLAAVHEVLRPGGMFMIYNLSPAPSKPGEPYKPWSDGRCPFTREQLEAAGFEVIAFDRTDHEAARRMGRLLGWADDPDGDGPQKGSDLENDLFSHWTLARRW
ncbi:MAG: hypothetical protein ACKVZJ_15195 [Phycisphaerales bacterium]